MSERIPSNPDINVTDPELLLSQAALRELSQEMLALKPEGSPLTYITIDTAATPGAVEDRLRGSRISDLLLKEGDSLSMPNGGDYYPDLDLYIGKAKLAGVMLRAWGCDFPKARDDESEPHGYREYEGEADWMHKLDILLYYANDKNWAVQEISVSSAQSNAGRMPSFTRDVSAPEYAETGYEGHNQAYRNAKDEDEVMEFLALVKELFDQSPQADRAYANYKSLTDSIDRTRQSRPQR